MTRTAICLVLLLAGPTSAHAGGKRATKGLQPEAEAAVAKVRGAARRRDYEGLRAMMISQFQWDFGADDGAELAIAEWKERRDILPRMVKILAKGCFSSAKDKVECPGEGGTGYRAGFIKTSSGWRMEYFIAGD
jgi:hypothetical protein